MMKSFRILIHKRQWSSINAMVEKTKEIVYPGIGHMDFPSVLEQLPNGTVGIVDHIKDWIEDK